MSTIKLLLKCVTILKRVTTVVEIGMPTILRKTVHARTHAQVYTKWGGGGLLMLAPIINANIPCLQVTVAYLGTDFAANGS